MRRFLWLRVAVGSAAALLLFGIGNVWLARSVPAQEPPRPDSAQARVKKLYRQHCQSCHDADGKGNFVRRRTPTIPDFTDQKWQQARTDTQLYLGIVDGIDPTMPGYRGKLSETEADQLVLYVRALGGPVKGTGATLDAAAQFRQLQQELADLQRQFHELSDPPKKEPEKKKP
jgi:mono/diheme cytochrome c family protein